MSLLLPWSLGFLAIVPIIVLFYILRAQHQQQEISSTHFWRNISSDLEGRPSRRLPLRSLLLLLQILTVVLLAVALARPSLMGGEKRHLILILDASVSMQATDIVPSRFEQAKQEARSLIDALGSGDDLTLIRAARSPSILESSAGPDRAPVLAALTAATPSGGSADVFSALALASSLASQHTDARNEVVVLSDGVFPKVDLGRLGSPPADVRLLSIGKSARNVAVTELSVRPMLGTSGRYVAFLRVASFADEAVEVPLKALADGIAIETRRLQLPPRGAAELTLNLPNGTKIVEAQLETDDSLRLDDQAQAVVAAPRQLNVTLVGTNTLFWDRVFKAMPQVKVNRVSPSSYRPQPADVVIFDGFEPIAAQWPSSSVLLVNPLPASRGDLGGLPVAPTGETGPVQVVRASRQTPILDGVDLASLVLQKSLRIKLPTWARAVAETTEGPLIAEGVYNGQKAVVYSFDPAQSELPQRLAFPILVSNTLSWLAPAEAPTAVKPGAVIEVPAAAGATEVVVKMPSGKAQAFQPLSGPVRFAQTDAVGRYSVTQRAGSDVVGQSTFVVNTTDEQASDIRPNPQALGAGLANAATVGPGVQQEVWPYLAAAALALLTFEWWYYCRRRA